MSDRRGTVGLWQTASVRLIVGNDDHPESVELSLDRLKEFVSERVAGRYKPCLMDILVILLVYGCTQRCREAECSTLITGQYFIEV